MCVVNFILFIFIAQNLLIAEPLKLTHRNPGVRSKPRLRTTDLEKITIRKLMLGSSTKYGIGYIEGNASVIASACHSSGIINWSHAHVSSRSFFN